jgi:hypothetical protein
VAGRHASTWPAGPGATGPSSPRRVIAPSGSTSPLIAGWANRGSGDGSNIGGRVGFHHKTLASFLEAFANAGLSIRAFREFFVPGRVVLPWDIALAAEKAG